MQQPSVPANFPKKKKGNGGLVALIVILSVALVTCIAGTVYLYFLNQDKEAEILENKKSQSVQKKEKSKRKEEERATALPATPEPVEIPDADNFSFRFNQIGLEKKPTYYRMEDPSFSYYCAIPENFIYAGDGMYYAPDNTALMQIHTRSNDAGYSVEDAMNLYILENGGEVTYSASGDDWFAISMKKNGISYYIKGFVDHYIREFTFDFPEEYLDVYDQYINYIEDNFKRTDK